MITLSIKTLREHETCALDARIAALAAHLGRRPTDDEPVPFVTWAEVTPFISDMIWALQCVDRGDRVAAEVARRAAARARGYARANIRAADDANDAAANAANAACAVDPSTVTYAAACAADCASCAAENAGYSCSAERAAQRADILELVSAAPC
jgi:hypothetical protein